MTQVKCPKSAMLDTSFFIRLGTGDAEPQPSRNAREWLKLLAEHNAALHVSTIALAEYAVKADYSELSLDRMRIVTFGLEHVSCAGAFARSLFEARKSGMLAAGNRAVIPNDAKMFAQAEVSQVEVFLTADEESMKIYNAIPPDKIHFKLVDIRKTSPGAYLGLLPFEES